MILIYDEFLGFLVSVRGVMKGIMFETTCLEIDIDPF
jgi:hypothetical protein